MKQWPIVIRYILPLGILVLIVTNHYVIVAAKRVMNKISPKSSKTYDYATPMYRRSTAQFRRYSCKGKIVFLGDSITDEIELNELFGSSDIVNRGIPGDVIQGVRYRASDYLKDTPRQVILLAGINNFNKFPEVDAREVFLEYRVIDSLCNAYGVPLTVICPIKTAMERVNKKIDALDLLMVKSEFKGRYLNLNDKIAPAGYLPRELTVDGLHLMPDAVAIIKEAVQPILKK